MAAMMTLLGTCKLENGIVDENLVEEKVSRKLAEGAKLLGVNLLPEVERIHCMVKDGEEFKVILKHKNTSTMTMMSANAARLRYPTLWKRFLQTSSRLTNV